MADLLGAVGAGIGVAAAAGQLIDGILKLHSFCSQFRDISEDVQFALDDLSAMAELFEIIQAEISEEIVPHHSAVNTISTKVFSILSKSSAQVGRVLDEMQQTMGKNQYWGRVKAVSMAKKLQRAAKRLEDAQGMVVMLLTAENRYGLRHVAFTTWADLEQDDVSTELQGSSDPAICSFDSNLLNCDSGYIYEHEVG